MPCVHRKNSSPAVSPARSATPLCSPSTNPFSPSASAPAPTPTSSGPPTASPAKASKSPRPTAAATSLTTGPAKSSATPSSRSLPRKDLHAYLRFLEQVLINTLAHLGLPTATRRDGLTGIWLGTRKIAALGVAVRRWVTYHGFALNVAPDLAHFGGIVPCGIASADGTVTSLAAELGTAPDLALVKTCPRPRILGAPSSAPL
jgi:hypothetical protein